MTNTDKLIAGIIKDGMQGKLDSLVMRARRLANNVKKDNPTFAKEIQETIGTPNLARNVQTHKNPVPVDSDTRHSLLTEYYPVTLESTPVWNEDVETILNRFVKEREFTNKLLDEGLIPARSILFEGPPGVGKTLAAKWLASSLGLPLLILDLATVMSSFLGKTGNNIRSVLNYASSFPCVLLLDEFDAIAKKRDDDSDVGELKRLVTVLLQSIDEWPATSIMIAATNHAELLDPAVWRRFDNIIKFSTPEIGNIRSFLIHKNIPENIADLVSHSAYGESFAIIEKKVWQAKKNMIIEETSFVSELLDVFNVAEDDLSGNDKLIQDFSIIKMTNEGYSQRKISEKLGVSRNYIKNLLTKSI